MVIFIFMSIVIDIKQAFYAQQIKKKEFRLTQGAEGSNKEKTRSLSVIWVAVFTKGGFAVI